MLDNLGNEVYGCIYKIICIVNNKCYIGQTIDYEKRRKEHIYELNKNIHSNAHLQNAWNKYGQENFTFEIIDYCYIFEDKAIRDQEYNWKVFYNVWDRNYGYNIAIKDNGGDNWTNHPNQKEWGEKISVANSGENNGMYGTCAYNIWVENFGIEEAEKRRQESKCKKSKSAKGRIFSTAHRKNLSIAAKNRKNMPKGINNSRYIVIPEDLIEKIIFFYTIKKIGRRGISKVLNISYSIITRVLNENKIQLRSHKENYSYIAQSKQFFKEMKKEIK